MDKKFQSFVDALHPQFERLQDAQPIQRGKFNVGLLLEGIYLFSENGVDLYVGRSRNIQRRYGLHTRPSAKHNQASFAFQLAKKELNLGPSSYRSDAQSRDGLSKDPEFLRVFNDAKRKVREMDFKWVEERDPTRQALLEIYCAVALGTQFNSFKTH
ncbi:MAG: hypothetical protein AAF871_17485 [Pseudomonadota bacterium]